MSKVFAGPQPPGLVQDLQTLDTVLAPGLGSFQDRFRTAAERKFKESTVSVTLTQVASAAGVSLATASRAFRTPQRLAQSTRERVISAASALGYAHPSTTDGLTLGLVVSDVANLMFGEQVAAIQELAAQEDTWCYVASASDDPSRERRALAQLGTRVDGIIILSPRQSPSEIESAVGRTPLVVVNGATWDICPTLVMTADKGIHQAVEHLYALGHRHVVFVPGVQDSWANTNRVQAITDATGAWGMRLSLVGNQPPSFRGGLAAAASVIASGATAAIGYNDLVALGVRAGAYSLGVSCPDGISIVGIDSFDLAAHSETPLTSIAIDLRRGAVRAYGMLMDLLAGRTTGPCLEKQDSELHVRASTWNAPVASINSSNRPHPSRPAFNPASQVTRSDAVGVLMNGDAAASSQPNLHHSSISTRPTPAANENINTGPCRPG